MRLAQISYAEFVGQPRYWRLHPIDVQQINLIVGKNAAGKSRTLNVINGLAQALSGVRQGIPDGAFFVEFLSGSDSCVYDLLVAHGQVVHERFLKNDIALLDRGGGGFGKIHALALDAIIDFQTPPNMLAATTRVDMVQHPFLAPLIDWAKKLYHYPCSTDLGRQTIVALRDSAPSVDPKDANQTTGVLRAAIGEFGSAFVEAVIRDMDRIGYHLSDVGLAAPTTVQVTGFGDVESVYVKENGIAAAIDQFSLSVGMFRALAIIIHLNYALLKRDAECILIDDIGEGLDYDRSSSLIKLIIDKVRASEMQVIMTTNDRYVMNGVKLEHWTVLSREGAEVSAYNSKNRPKEFEEFKFTGLSNFDFFARNFLATVH